MRNDNAITEDNISNIILNPNMVKELFKELELSLLKLALETTNGNQRAAAKLLGMNRNTLHKRAKEHGLDTWEFR